MAKSPWNPQLEALFQDHQSASLIDNFRFASLLGTVLFPALAIHDAFTFPEEFRTLSLIRLICVAVFLGAYRISHARGFKVQHVFPSTLALLFTITCGVVTICFRTGGWNSPHWASIVLLIFSAVIWMNSNAGAVTLTVIGISAIHLIGNYLHEGLLPGKYALFANQAGFLGLCIALAYAGAKTLERGRRESFLRWLEARELPRVRQSRDEAHGALEIRDEFISIASHELKSPIAAMKLQNEILRRQLSRASITGEPPAAADEISRMRARFQEWLDRNASQLERQMRLIDDMLDISQINTGRLRYDPQPLDIGLLTKELCDRFHAQFAAARIRLCESLERGITVYGDRARLEQVLVNLFTNAIRYAPDSPLAVRLGFNHGMAKLEIEDQGIGIDAAHHERIFQRFERATAVSGIQGLGLGLYIARKIIEGHHGRITVQSERGKGATFTIELPAETLMHLHAGFEERFDEFGAPGPSVIRPLRK